MLRRVTLATTLAAAICIATPALSVPIDSLARISGLYATTPADRCICFDAYTNCSGCPTRVSQVFTFGLPGALSDHASRTIVVDGVRTAFIDAVDPLHTLRDYSTRRV